ncbi:MAG: DUF4421 domain-containing protein [Leptospirales bacterium]|nr:DUF4421 domain-containing protein [Leptospirales bacterium]
MNKKLFYLLLISFFMAAPLYAQEEREAQEEFDANTYTPYIEHEDPKKENAAYIEPFGNKFSLHLSAYMSDLSFIHTYDRPAGRFQSGRASNDADEGYIANRPLDIGLGFLYGNLGLELRQQTSLLYDSDYEKTETLEWQLNYYAKSASFEFQVKDYKGFRTDSGEETDMHLRCTGIFGQYIWNNEEYSWRAAFGLYERQLRSAGSFLLGGGAFHLISHLPGSYKKRYILAIPNAGYAHTWVFGSNLFFALSPSAGFGIAHELSKTKNYPAVSFSLSGAAGYHWKDISFMLSYKTIGFSIPLSRSKTDSFITTMLQCSVAKRF